MKVKRVVSYCGAFSSYFPCPLVQAVSIEESLSAIASCTPSRFVKLLLEVSEVDCEIGGNQLRTQHAGVIAQMLADILIKRLNGQPEGTGKRWRRFYELRSQFRRVLPFAMREIGSRSVHLHSL